MNVNGKVAVVTGGASGIGLALCTRFAKARDYDQYIAMMRAGRAEEVGRTATAS